MSDNGHGDSFEDREIATELAILKIRHEHLEKDVNERMLQQNKLNEKLVEANQMMAKATAALEISMAHQDTAIQGLERVNSLQSKLMYAIATAALSTFVGLLSLIAKTFLLKG